MRGGWQIWLWSGWGRERLTRVKLSEGTGGGGGRRRDERALRIECGRTALGECLLLWTCHPVQGVPPAFVMAASILASDFSRPRRTRQSYTPGPTPWPVVLRRRAWIRVPVCSPVSVE